MKKTVLKKISIYLGIFGLPVLLGFAAYGFIWWKTASAAKQFATQLAPYATMEYTDIHIDLLNPELGLKGLSFWPTGAEDAIYLESIKLKVPSWTYFLDLKSALNKGQFPEHINLEVKGLNIDLEGDYMMAWASAVEQQQRLANHHGYNALACGDLQYFTLEDMRNMGYMHINTDFAIQYHFDKLAKQANLDVQSTSSAVMRSALSLSVGFNTDTLTQQTLVFAEPKLKQLEMRFADQGYNLRRSKYCADLNGESRELYLAEYNLQFKEQLAMEGWQIPDYIYEAMATLNEPGGRMYMRLDLPDNFGAQQMVLLQSPAQVIEALNPYVEFNDKPVLIQGINWEPPSPEASRLAALKRKNAAQSSERKDTDQKSDDEIASSQQSNDSVFSDIVDEAGGGDGSNEVDNEIALTDDTINPTLSQDEVILKPKAKANKYTKPFQGYKKVAVTDLEGNLGRKVRLYTYFGQSVEGELIRVSSQVVTIEQRLVDGKGTATYPIAKDKIQLAELYHP